MYTSVVESLIGTISRDCEGVSYVVWSVESSKTTVNKDFPLSEYMLTIYFHVYGVSDIESSPPKRVCSSRSDHPYFTVGSRLFGSRDRRLRGFS